MQVSRKLIENVGELKKALNEISVYDFDVYTSMELYYKIANKLNEVIKELMRFEGLVSDEVIKQNEKLIYLLGEGLNNEVVKKINQMVVDGTMDTIINHSVFNSLNNKIEDIDKRTLTFTNIENLKNATLNINDKCLLTGYYADNDSERHYRIISDTDDGTGILLNNGLYANIIHNGYLKAEWFGAISSNETDYRQIEFQKFLDYIKTGKAKCFDIGSKNIYINKPTSLVFNESGGNFTLKSSGGVLVYNISDELPCLKIGLESSSYCSLNKVILEDIKIKANGNQSDALKLYTEGRSDLAFWDSKFKNISISSNRGKGLRIMNGVFECKFDEIRIDMRRKHQETTCDPITNNDIGLYLVNDKDNNIISSLYFNFVNIWGGYHCIKTNGINGKYAPDFSCIECHVFDSKAEALYLNNQNGSNYIKKLHMEFIGTNDSPVYGCFWNGNGGIDLVEGGGDYMKGYIRLNVNNNSLMKITDITAPYNMPLKECYISYNGDTGSILETNTNFKNLKITDWAKGKIICLKDGRKMEIDLTGWHEKVFINTSQYNGNIITTHQGVNNRVAFTFNSPSGIKGGETDLSTLDFTPTSTVIGWDNGNGVQNNVKLGFFGNTPIQKPRIEGNRNSNEALRQLLIQLQNLGLIEDGTTE